MAALFFTYGSLKRGFPNHTDHEEALRDFVGTAVTCDELPLIVPHEPNCTNPNCPWLHRMPTLVDLVGQGKKVRGEVFRLAENDLKNLDKLEGFIGAGNPDNVYERKLIDVRIDDETVSVEAYFVADAESKLQQWQQGQADVYEDYTLDMAATTPKP